MLTEKQGSVFVNRYQRGAGGELLTRPGFGSTGETPQMDGLGNMRQALSNGSSTLAGSFDYSAFGELIGGSGSSSSSYGWGAQSGYRQDSGSGQGDCGLVLMGARWYDPATGRFTSRDSNMGSELLTIPALAGLESVLPALGHNAYCYCEGDPVNCTDPSGRCPTYGKKTMTAEQIKQMQQADGSALIDFSKIFGASAAVVRGGGWAAGFVPGGQLFAGGMVSAGTVMGGIAGAAYLLGRAEGGK